MPGSICLVSLHCNRIILFIISIRYIEIDSLEKPMRSSALVVLSALLIAGCAKRPDAIVPVDIPISAYSGQSCSSLRRDLASERAKLEVLSASQNSAATGDAVGVFLIGVPVSSLGGGDQEGNLAVSKGKVQAMELAMKQKGCRA